MVINHHNEDDEKKIDGNDIKDADDNIKYYKPDNYNSYDNHNYCNNNYIKIILRTTMMTVIQ